MVNNIDKTLNSLLEVDFFELEITTEIIKSVFNKQSAIKLLSVCIEKADKFYLPLRKMYSLDVRTEELFSEVSEDQIKATESLEHLVSLYSQKLDIPNQELMDILLEDTVSESNEDEEASKIPLALKPLMPQIYLHKQIINNAEKRNIKILSHIIKQRVVNSDLEYLLPDWNDSDTVNMGSKFMIAMFGNFIWNERLGWSEPDEADESDFLETKPDTNIKKLKSVDKKDTTKSTKILNSGKSTTVDTVAS